MAELMSQTMDYTKMRQKATASMATRNIYSATNGNTFSMGQTIEIQIPGNVSNTFLDWESSYLKLTITNNDTAAIKFSSSAGVYSLIRKVEILSSGMTLCSIQDYDKLVSLYSDIQFSATHKNDSINLTQGVVSSEASNFDDNIVLAAGNSRTFCLPLHLIPFCSQSKYFPLFSSDNLRLRLTLNTALDGVIHVSSDTPTLDSEIVVSPVEMVAVNIRLNDNAFKALDSMVGGKYNLVCDDYRHSSAAIGANDTTFSINTSFSHFSLDKILFSFYPSENKALEDGQNRISRGMTEYSFVNSGTHYPARKIRMNATNDGNVSEPLSELSNCFNNLYDAQATGSLNKGAGYGAAAAAGTENDTVGKFVAGVNLQQVREHGAESLYSGIDSRGGVNQIEGVIAAGTQCNLHAYSKFTVIYSLDTRGSNTWTYFS